MNQFPKPKGKVEVIKFKPKEPNAFVARATLVCKDEAGDLWEFAASHTVSGLQPHCPTQSLGLYEWDRAFHKHLGYYPKPADSMIVAMYREGLSPEQAATSWKEEGARSR